MEKVKVVDVDEETNKTLNAMFPDWRKDGYVRVGEGGYLFPRSYVQCADAVRNMTVRPDDVWVLGFPRSGTTMTEELVWLLTHALDYAAAAAPLDQRYHYINFDLLYKDTDFEAAASPRHFKAHVPLSLLPRALLSTARVVHVARDPRDVAVSLYHYHKMMKYRYTATMKAHWELFHNNNVFLSPYFGNVLESWNARHHPNMMFIFYEELTKDLPGTIKRLANFFGKNYSEEEIQGLCAHMSFDTFKDNAAIHPDLRPGAAYTRADAPAFVRRGKVNAWREYFDEKMTEQAERWLQERLRATDLRFPTELRY